MDPCQHRMLERAHKKQSTNTPHLPSSPRRTSSWLSLQPDLWFSKCITGEILTQDQFGAFSPASGGLSLLFWNSRMQGPGSDLDQIPPVPKKRDHTAQRLWWRRRAKVLIWAPHDGRWKWEIRHQRSNLSNHYGPICASGVWRLQKNTNPPGGTNSAALSVTVMEDLCHRGAPSASPGVAQCLTLSQQTVVRFKEQTCPPSGHPCWFGLWIYHSTPGDGHVSHFHHALLTLWFQTSCTAFTHSALTGLFHIPGPASGTDLLHFCTNAWMTKPWQTHQTRMC